MKKANCWVIVNGSEHPDFGGHFETREDVYSHYEHYDTFTQRTYITLRAAKRDADKLDEAVKDGGDCWIVCGVYCEECK